MSNIHYLNIPFKTPLNTSKITDDLIEILYDLLPSNFSHWSLKLAQARFNQRQSQDASTWHDKLQVYVGLADWVLTEEQMLSERTTHKMPIWAIGEPLRRYREQFKRRYPLQERVYSHWSVL